MKDRERIRIDRDISDALTALAAGEKGYKSRLVNDGLREWLAHRGNREVDDLLRLRLDRMTREIARARRDIEVLLESLSLFVRYQLMVTAPLPEADAAAAAVGRARFEKFVAQVGRQLATNRRTLGPADEPEPES
jgi:hypothetical protein